MPRAKAKAIAGDAGDSGGARKLEAESEGAQRQKKVKVVAMEKRESGAETRDPAREETVILPDSLDSASAASIQELLLSRRGSPVVVDAGQVNRVGVQALQVLISAAQTWRADGQSYKVRNPSSELVETLALVGLSADQLLLEGSSP